MKSKSENGQVLGLKSLPAAFLNVHKPKGITSHDVVYRVRKITGIKQVGHAGTLDPMATGVMVVALGKACRLLRFLDDDKSYKATITLGTVTDTDDIEGKVLSQNESAISNPPDEKKLLEALNFFRGTIEQIPPYYSAIHVDGKRLYELARAGQAPPEIKARTVTIEKLDLVSYAAPIVVIRVHCSKGTYIRSIARDLGEKLELGGTLSGLVRESAGKFRIEQSISLEDLAESEKLEQAIVPVNQAIALPSLAVSADCARRLIMGQKIDRQDLAAELELDLGCEIEGEQYILVSDKENGAPFCVGRLNATNLAPEVVFANV